MVVAVLLVAAARVPLVTSHWHKVSAMIAPTALAAAMPLELLPPRPTPDFTHPPDLVVLSHLSLLDQIKAGNLLECGGEVPTASQH